MHIPTSSSCPLHLIPSVFLPLASLNSHSSSALSSATRPSLHLQTHPPYLHGAKSSTSPSLYHALCLLYLIKSFTLTAL
ncbi:hypothetical protein E2C01_048907 [Portunus trituberculatus]|uniref:Uncharacterized protein n=1 Tax=Portunus trituberculatus TaxID=210409 RepID=A0A5B7GBS2_PORTR|nr:hypothetical protein [Portunus trituberculatus]